MSHQETGALVIIFDVGNSVSGHTLEDGKTFFQKSKDCISWILRRKILSMNKDVVSILLTGTNEEGEFLDDLDVTLCRNISIKYDFQPASWEMLYYIDEKVKPSDKISDWVGTLSVAIEKIKILEESFKVSSKTIAIFSDLNYTFAEAVSTVLEGVKDCNIEVNVIGSDCFSQPSENEEDDGWEPSAKIPRLEEEIRKLENNESINGDSLLYVMWRYVGDLITVCNFNSAMRHLSYYVMRKPRPTPWNCVMDVGDFKINVQVFKKIDRKSHYRPNLKCQKSLGDSNVSGLSQKKYSDVTVDKVMYYKHPSTKSIEIQEVPVTDDDVVAGYRYGTSIIPFSDEDRIILGYKPGKKSFTVLGFTTVDKIPYCALVGEGCYIVVPRQNDKCAEVSLSALVQAMSETGKVAIIRRVYSDDRGLSLGVLYPVVEDQEETNHKECLIYIELAFHEELRIVHLPGLRRIKSKISQEQYDVVDNLIKEMDLMECQSGGKNQVYEELDLSTRHEIKNQFFSHCVVQKALYPDEPLPEELSPYYLKSITLSDSSSNKIEKFDAKLLELFPIKGKGSVSDSVTTSDGREKAAGTWFCSSSLENEKNPESCFRKLFDELGFPPPEEIQNLMDLFDKSSSFKEEIVQALLKLTRESRQRTVENFTDDYNFWMRRLRIFLGTEKQWARNYWNGVLEGNLGLITEEEHKKSCTKKEDAEFFNNSLKPNFDNEEERTRVTKEGEEAINMLF